MINDFEFNASALIERLAAVRGRDIPAVTIRGITALFEAMGAKMALRVVSVIEEYENVPSNILGLVKRVWNEQKNREGKNIENRETWQAQPGCCTPEELSWMAKICYEIMFWHIQKLTSKNVNGVVVPMSIDEWKRLGRPSTYSPILDFFLTGFEKAYLLPGKGCEEFLKTFYEQLHSERIKRVKNN